MSNKVLLKSLAVTGLMALTGAAQAAITLYTSEADFNAATMDQYVDTFDDIIVDGTTDSPQTRSNGIYGYTASTPDGYFFGSGTALNPHLSSNDATEAITFTSFTGGVQAAGANFFGTDYFGAYASGSIRVTATDTTGGSSTLVIGGATESSFLGFVSDSQLLTFTVAAVQPSGTDLWPSVDNLRLATAVPEPETSALMMLGLGVLGWIGRRRTAQAV